MFYGPEQTAPTGRLSPIYLEGRPLPLATPIAQQLGLREGQIIQATIELRGDSLKLLLNGKLLDLPPGLRFSPGDALWLRANRGANGWQLKPVDQGAEHATALEPLPIPVMPATEPAGISRLLALSLRPPMPSTLLELFQPAQVTSLLQTAANPELTVLFQRLQLSMRGLSSNSLQNAVMSSGFWFEALLGSGQSAGRADMKSMLRRLIRSLDDKESPVAGKLHKAIDDIESSQVESLAAQARGEISFAMVLPFVDANPVEIRFFRPARRPGQEAPPFSVDIQTENETLGEIWLKTSITRASHVDLMMWAMKDSVYRLARLHSEKLGSRLTQAGLTMDSFRVFHSARPSLPESWNPPGAMLDVSA